MIVLKKSRILIMICLVVTSIVSYNITTNKIESNAVPTVSLPVSNKVIVIDAGHGIPDEGAESSTRYNRSRN